MFSVTMTDACRYDLVLQCWQLEAEDRPSFRSIVASLNLINEMDVETSL